MAKKTKFFTSLLALLFGFLIFTISLVMSSQVQSNNSLKASERKFYFGSKILPDHVLYPFLMVADKIILETSFGNRRVYVKIKLANDRLLNSKMLLEKKEEKLALSTMTKSQKYLITASQDFFKNDDRSEIVKKTLLKSLKNNSTKLKKYKQFFTTTNTMPIDDLLQESSVLIQRLEN